MSGSETRGPDQFEFAPAPAKGSKWNIYMADVINEPHNEAEPTAVFADLTFDTDPVSSLAGEEPVLHGVADQDFWL